MGLTRPKHARKVSKIGNRMLSYFSGRKNHESEITEQMMAIAEDFPSEAAMEGIQVISLGGGLSQNYDQEKFWQGWYTKRYRYEYLVPYVSEKTGDPRHYRCFMHFTKEWFREESMGRPEMLGYMDCDTSRDGDKKLEWDLERLGLVVEFDDDKRQWAVTDVNEVVSRSTL